MTSPPVYPAEYYYPEFIESRPDDPHISTPPHPPLSTSITATTNIEQITERKKKSKKNLAMDVVTDQGLPDADITQVLKTDPKRSLVRNPVEKTIPRLLVDDNIIKQAVRITRFPRTNLEDENIESKKTSDNQTNGHVPNQTKIQTIPAEPVTKQQHQIVSTVGYEQPMDDYWKNQGFIKNEEVVTIEPVKYDKNSYEGPFGLKRQASLIYYISLSIITILAAAMLIMIGIFYGQSYPSSSSNTAELAGLGACAFVFYLGLQLILIGMWHQTYRYENPVEKKSTVHNESSDYLKSAMENNEQYDNSYQQQLDYTPFDYYSSPPYASNVNEQMLLQQPGAATGSAFYESVVWPSNVEVETQPDSKFYQPMEWSLGPQQSTLDMTQPTAIHTSISNLPDHTTKRKKKHKPTKTVEAQPELAEFDNIHLNSSVIEQPLPVLPKAPETNDMIKNIAQMEQTLDKSTISGDISSKKHNRVKPAETRSDVSFFNDSEKNHDHHHRRHRSHHNHHRHHHNNRRSHHHHRRRSYSPCSQCSDDHHRDHHHRDHHHQDHHHRDHHHQDHHHRDHHHQDQHYPHHQYYQHPHQSHSVSLPRLVTPNFPKIITPTPRKTNTEVYRDTGVNTGSETKIMRDSSVTADLEDVPNTADNWLEKVPVVRRTIIVEPYPAQPSSQILVKPRADMIGKIRLGKSTKLSGDNETIVYPSTAFMRKKSHKKMKTTTINNNMIEDLHLEDIYDDDDDGSMKIKKNKPSARKTIRNAFYN